MSTRTTHLVSAEIVETYSFEWGRPLHTRATLVCIEHNVAAPFHTWDEVMKKEFVPLWKCDEGEILNERSVRKHGWYESRHPYKGRRKS
jgi:hypothetical protein